MPGAQPLSLTIIIPAHNEEDCIQAAVRDAFTVYPTHTDLLNVVVVDDASEDRTLAVVETLARTEARLRVIALPRNVGAGRAVCVGIAASTSDFVAFLPADGQVRGAQVRKCLDFALNADFVWTVRTHRADPLVRRLLALIYNFWVRLLFRVPVHDVDSIFLARRPLVQELLLVAECRSDFLPVELLVRAQRRGWRVVEVAIDHYPRERGKASAVRLRPVVRTLLDAVRMFRAWHLGSGGHGDCACSQCPERRGCVAGPSHSRVSRARSEAEHVPDDAETGP